MQAIYLAGSLFTQAERRWNRDLKNAIEKISGGSVRVTLPQLEADQFMTEEKINFDGIVQVCVEGVESHDVVVANLDGADIDSGTALEVGLRIAGHKAQGKAPLVIGVRTDLRTRGEDPKTGINAMFRLCDEIVYFPATDLSVEKLAREILQAIIDVTHRQGSS